MQPHFELPNDDGLRGRWQVPTGAPDDPMLPGLGTIRTFGIAGALPDLGLGDEPIELRLCNYVPGSRATFEVRSGTRHFALKLYAEDPTSEAALYERLAGVGLAGDTGARAPRLLAFDRDLRALAIGWLDGRPANRLVKEHQGERAGELAASWIRHAARRRVKLGPPCGPGRMLYQIGVSVSALMASDGVLGSAAKTIAKTLVRGQPKEDLRHLVHGTFYARHILDLGDGPGVIDWQQFGQGPLEVDAGMFLATTSRIALRHTALSPEAARAESAFLSKTDGLFDERTLDWYTAAGLLHLAASGLKTHGMHAARPEAIPLVDEAARRAASAARNERGSEETRRSRWGRLRRRSNHGSDSPASAVEMFR